MKPYNQKRLWKYLLLVFAVVIAAGSLIYTRFLTRNIAVITDSAVTCWFASGPWNPPDNSAQRNTHRVKMVNVATASPHKKNLNLALARKAVKDGFMSAAEAFRKR